MVIFQLGEETEGIAFLFSGIEEDNLVAESLVEFLVLVEQRACAQVRDGQRSLAGYNPQGCKESDTTEYACTHT